ncbi:MAG: hypothetical protein ACPGJV_15630, partial [Bacteriovoracaceae bacterium]
MEDSVLDVTSRLRLRAILPLIRKRVHQLKKKHGKEISVFIDPNVLEKLTTNKEFNFKLDENGKLNLDGIDTISELLKTWGRQNSPELLKTWGRQNSPELLKTWGRQNSPELLKTWGRQNSPELLKTWGRQNSPELLKTWGRQNSPELLKTWGRQNS